MLSFRALRYFITGVVNAREKVLVAVASDDVELGLVRISLAGT